MNKLAVLLFLSSLLLLGCTGSVQQTNPVEAGQPETTVSQPPTPAIATTSPPTPQVTTVMTREGYPTMVPLSALATPRPTPTPKTFCEPDTKKCVEKPFEGYEPTEGSTPAFSCVCDSAGRACIKTESCSNGCRNGQCLPEPAVKALPKESVPTPPPFPATECEADKVTETDTPAGKSRTKIIGIEKIMVFGRACSTCHQKFEYIGSGRYVERWSSRNFDAGEPGACQKMTLTVANPENPAELKIDVSEMWINGLRQTCVKENGAMKSGPDVKCD